jgi:hypothetical protein
MNYLKLITANLGKLNDITFGYDWILANRANENLFNVKLICNTYQVHFTKRL